VSIFVGNLPFRAEREDVLQLFVPFGEVLNCSLPLERETGRKRGFAFVEMADEAIEATAIEGLQGTEMMGRPLRINKAEPRTNSPRRNNNFDSSRSKSNEGRYAGNSSNSGYGGKYGGSSSNSGYGGSYGGNTSNSGYGASYGTNSPSNEYGNDNLDSNSKTSGAKGWEDRSYGNSSDNEYENGRSRRRRGAANDMDDERTDA
tara:strand:- start:431 stop:1039 length:609 start_codon:yes stop_codon:yes gene_type:complete